MLREREAPGVGVGTVVARMLVFRTLIPCHG